MSADKVRKLPGQNKYTDITLKRGMVTAPDAEDASLKKLPGKKKPPTLTLNGREK